MAWNPHFMAKITIKELESLTANDAGRILREGGNLAGRISLRKDGCNTMSSKEINFALTSEGRAAGWWA